jgi:hypothetical protein
LHSPSFFFFRAGISHVLIARNIFEKRRMCVGIAIVRWVSR